MVAEDCFQVEYLFHDTKKRLSIYDILVHVTKSVGNSRFGHNY